MKNHSANTRTFKFSKYKPIEKYYVGIEFYYTTWFKFSLYHIKQIKCE